MSEIVVIPTGTANLASVRAAFMRLGAKVRLSGEPQAVSEAAGVMLPGVGAFGAAMAALAETGADEALRARIDADGPTIAICVGHQLLFEASEESPAVRGLGVIAGMCRRFPDHVRVPQFGWNRITGHGRFLDEGYAYFANSYFAAEAPGWEVATAEHGVSFVAGMERGNILGCQFHPELSGAYGAALLSRWLETTRT